jgi:hypothetical protein
MSNENKSEILDKSDTSNFGPSQPSVVPSMNNPQSVLYDVTNENDFSRLHTLDNNILVSDRIHRSPKFEEKDVKSNSNRLNGSEPNDFNDLNKIENE